MPKRVQGVELTDPFFGNAFMERSCRSTDRRPERRVETSLPAEDINLHTNMFRHLLFTIHDPAHTCMHLKDAGVYPPNDFKSFTLQFFKRQALSSCNSHQ